MRKVIKRSSLGIGSRRSAARLERKKKLGDVSIPINDYIEQ
jgi:hypothetical protein